MAVFTGSGALLGAQTDGNLAATDPTTGLAADVFFGIFLPSPGAYIVGLSQEPNFTNGMTLSDGFGPPDGITLGSGCSNGMFCDATGVNRTSAYAFDILGVNSAQLRETLEPMPPMEPTTPVPVPAALPLMVGALGGLALLRRRRG